jgi:hypothetical protein
MYGSFSGFHIFTNQGGADIVPSRFDPVPFFNDMINRPRGAGVASSLRMGLLVNGVDVNSGPAGWVSAVHGEAEMAVTLDAMRATVRALRREGMV